MAEAERIDEWDRFSMLMHYVEGMASALSGDSETTADWSRFNVYRQVTEEPETEDNEAAFAFMKSVDMTAMLPPEAQTKALEQIVETYGKRVNQSG